MDDSMEPPSRPTIPILAVIIPLMIGLGPYLYVLYKYPAHREWVLTTFGCRSCCNRGVRYDAADLQAIRELQEPPPRENIGINGAYRKYLARSQMALGLTAWREDVQKLGVSENPQFQLPNTQNSGSPSHISATIGRESPTASVASSTANLPLDMVVVVVNDRGQDPDRSTELSFEEEAGYEALPVTPKNLERPSTAAERPRVVSNEEEQPRQEADRQRQHPRGDELV